MKQELINAKKRKTKATLEEERQLIDQAMSQIIAIQKEEKQLKIRLKTLKTLVMTHMEENEQDMLEAPYSELSNIKALRYEQNKVIYNDDILKFLKGKDLISAACKIVVDDKKMEGLYNTGQLAPEEVAKYAEIKNTKAFKVSLVKK